MAEIQAASWAQGGLVCVPLLLAEAYTACAPVRQITLRRAARLEGASNPSVATARVGGGFQRHVGALSELTIVTVRRFEFRPTVTPNMICVCRNVLAELLMSMST